MLSDNHELLKKLEELFRIEFIGNYEDDTCSVKKVGITNRIIKDLDDEQLCFNLKEFKECVQQLSNMKQVDELLIYDKKNYEVVALQENRKIPFFRSDISISNNEISYSFGKVSFTFLLHLISIVNKTEINHLIRMGRRSWIDESLKLENGLYNFNELLCDSLRLYSIKISTEKESLNENNINKYETSYKFHLAYNLDITLIPQRFLEEILGSNRIRSMREEDIQDLDIPKKFYNEDIVSHYILAISSDNLVIQYLSYYHVIEHFFNKISDEEITSCFRDIITSENFSYKKDKDIMRAVDKIKSFYMKKIIDDDLNYNEFDSLKLCLKKYIKIKEDILDKITAYKPELIDFYKNNTVYFSEGDKVNLNNNDELNVISTLAKRIYYTRNSLVHSKDGEKKKYEPFKHDKYLIKEIPLLRFIAESIITQESKII
ncbi:hypothetical protein [Acinetobacter rongchengensis]|uniref:Uncharacterized protein n=1 Tax=Acinetobacter rongchengensis TaxID=2419601 RepID=A0A3A8F523_9GAMM|nr:hypothetical protein [Acinetobacter rongchengensis]RKG40846.1 hypothetical protein D7V20_00175 [Acinetobacter rongchengensis]